MLLKLRVPCDDTLGVCVIDDAKVVVLDMPGLTDKAAVIVAPENVP